MRTSILILFIVSLYIGNTSAQNHMHVLNAFPKCAKLAAASDRAQLLFMTRNSLQKKVIGQAFFNDWESAFLLSNDDQVHSVKARYRVFDDEFQIMLNGKEKAVFPQMIKGIIFKNKAFVSKKFEFNGQVAYSYFQLISEGDVDLLKRYGMPIKSAKNGFYKLSNIQTEWYYQIDKEPAKILSLKQKDIVKILGKEDKVIRNYIQQERINLNIETELKKLFDYYNTLQ